MKKFSGTAKDETPSTTAEAVVEQKPQQYFEHVQRPPETLALTAESKDDMTERPKSTEEQPRAVSREQKQIEHHERHTQSDTEQIITETQKKRRRPKRVSRTSQTYECVFRRMERDQQHDIRVTSDTEKNIQTRKSQLRPRKKSPRKNLPVYLSTDSFKYQLTWFFFNQNDLFRILDWKNYCRNNIINLDEICRNHRLLLVVYHHREENS